MGGRIVPTFCPRCILHASRAPRAPRKKMTYDLTGQIFGRLHVQHFFGIVNDRVLWCCLCQCDTARLVGSKDLRTGKTQACGCLNREIKSKMLLADGTMMRCSQCKEAKLLEAFGNHKQHPHGKQAQCRNCQKKKNQAYYAANRQKLCADVRAYSMAHPEVASTTKARRRAHKLGAAINDLTNAQWEEIKAAYGHRCVYCGRKRKRLTRDHISPLSKNGDHTASNIVPACRSCNSRKHAGPPLIPVQPLLLTISPARPHKARQS